MSDNPMDKIVQLRDLVSEKAAEVGLHLEGFGIFPSTDPDDPYTYAQAVFHIDMGVAFGEPEAEVDPEQAQFDDAFESLMGSQVEFAKAAEIAAARAEIAQSLTLNDAKRGIGLDD